MKYLFVSASLLMSLVSTTAVSAAAVSPAAKAPTCQPDFSPATGSYQFVEEDSASVPTDSEATVGRIHYTRLPVFDEENPKENNAIYRFGNRFHVLTRERTVARDILFAPGESVDVRAIEESARLLRARNHLYDADIRVVSRCDDKLDLEVITRDAWSFTPEISFDRSGGQDTFRVGVAETNLFGLGRAVSFVAENDIDRNSARFTYEDANIGGSRIGVKTEYTDSDDGFQQFAKLGQPFYSLDAKSSWAVVFDKVKRNDAQFFRGNEVSEVRHEIEEVRFSWGTSKGLVDGVARRWSFGFTYRDDRFSESPNLPPPPVFPQDRVFAYPSIGFSSIEDNYVTSFNINEIKRTEDLHLGHSFVASLGYSTTVLGADDDRLISRARFDDTLHFNDRQLLQHSVSFEGLYNLDAGESEDVLLGYEIRYFRSRNEKRAFYATFDALYSHNLNTDRQIMMGGLSGTRAFDNRFQVGDRRVHLSLEERQYTNLHILNLVRVGYAAFLDVGRAWAPGVDDGLTDDVLANVGVGIRLASSKANVGRIVHIDFAFPLTNRDDPLVDSVQVSINVKNSL